MKTKTEKIPKKEKIPEAERIPKKEHGGPPKALKEDYQVELERRLNKILAEHPCSRRKWSTDEMKEEYIRQNS